MKGRGPGRLRFFTPDSGVLLSGTYGGNAFGALDLKPFSAEAHFFPCWSWVTYDYMSMGFLYFYHYNELHSSDYHSYIGTYIYTI